MAATAAWSAVRTAAVAKLVGSAVGVRVKAEAEYEWLDISSRGERAYGFFGWEATSPGDHKAEIGRCLTFAKDPKTIANGQ